MDNDHTTPGGHPQPRQEHDYSSDDYERFTPPGRPKKSSRSRWIILIIVLLVVIAGAVYWFVLRTKPAPPKPSTNQTSQQNSSKANASQIDTSTKHYDSANLNLGFDYPADWTVTDTAGSGILTAVSPALQLKDASGQTITGQITLTVRNNQQPVTEFDKGSAIAALDSQKIAYAKPTASQRGNTYVSFLRYATDTSSAGLDGVYITGDAGYKAGQGIPKTDIVKVSPIVSIIFAKCNDSSCSAAGTPLSIASSGWSDTSLSNPLITMLESFSFE